MRTEIVIKEILKSLLSMKVSLNATKPSDCFPVALRETLLPVKKNPG